MKLSIIIPIFNAEKYIETCLDTVSKCPMKDMECILVNDGSWDNSQDICERFISNDKRFVLINKENGGVSEARNTGIKKCQR
jgi:glycosyltransferase involved in cell wall biosynthesis